MCKLIHTSIAEGKNAKEELYKYLLQYRATPHSTTEKSPAEMLFNRKLQTKLPQLTVRTETDEQKETRQIHDNKKLQQKRYFDKRKNTKPKDINIGDEVLLKQRKSTTKPPFDPKPLTVTATKGNQVHACRTDGFTRVRDKNQLKKVNPRPSYLRPSWERLQSKNVNDYSLNEIECNTESLFDIDNETSSQLQQLLQAAESRENERINTTASSTAENYGTGSNETQRVTRSKGLKLKWNPMLNDKTVVIQSEQ